MKNARIPDLTPAAPLPVAAWLYLTFGRGGFWRIWPELPDASRAADWPDVAVVVPARNEAATLPHTLPALLDQDYPGDYHVYLVDDHSSDGTTGVARELAGATAHARRLTAIQARPRPAGWAGKVWAMREGVEAADTRAPLFVLFTDADITHPRDSVRRLVAHAQREHLDLVSLMALLRTATGWERLLIPAFVYFFALIYPFRWVADPACRTAAAAGGCLLVRREALRRAGGLDAIASRIIDDVSLAQAIKGSGGRLWLGFTTGVVSVRGYDSLHGIWTMVARTAYTQLRHSPLLLAGTVIGLGITFLAPVAATASAAGAIAGRRRRPRSSGVTALTGAAAWGLMALTYAPMRRLYGLPRAGAMLLPLSATLYMAMTVSSAWRHWTGRGHRWKGRSMVDSAPEERTP